MKVRYYYSEDEDFIESSKQDYKLKSNYKWIHHNIVYQLLSYLAYYIVLIVAFIYTKVFLRERIINRGVLKSQDGCYLYSNHTQMLGDVLSPFLIAFPKRPYIVCSPANLGIPIIGKILPLCGALPIPDNIKQMKSFREAIDYHINKKQVVVIYPEAHLWPWYTKVRSFNKSSLHFPVDSKAVVYTATTTYQKSRIFNHPRIDIYVDGPISIKKDYSRQENIEYLRNIVYDVMSNRALTSNQEYIIYKKRKRD